MKQSLLAMVAVAGLSLLGCGGAVAEDLPEPLEASESLASCNPAFPQCGALEGQACSPRGAKRDCCMDGWQGWCTCSPAGTWICVY